MGWLVRLSALVYACPGWLTRKHEFLSKVLKANDQWYRLSSLLGATRNIRNPGCSLQWLEVFKLDFSKNPLTVALLALTWPLGCREDHLSIQEHCTPVQLQRVLVSVLQMLIGKF